MQYLLGHRGCNGCRKSTVQALLLQYCRPVTSMTVLLQYETGTFGFLSEFPVACFLLGLACSMSRHLSLMRLKAPNFSTESFTQRACNHMILSSPLLAFRTCS